MDQFPDTADFRAFWSLLEAIALHVVISWCGIEPSFEALCCTETFLCRNDSILLLWLVERM